MDTSVRLAYPSKKGSAYIMEEDWAWHSFLEDLEKGNVSVALKNAMDDPNKKTILKIEGGYIPDPESFNPYDETFRKTWARYAFSYNYESGSYHIFHEKDSSDIDAANTMRGLKDAQSLTQIADKLKSITSEGKWLWIDIWLGFCFKIFKGSKTKTCVSSEKLWELYLSHFSIWL